MPSRSRSQEGGLGKWILVAIVVGVLAVALVVLLILQQIHQDKVDALTERHKSLIQKVLSDPVPTTTIQPPFDPKRLLVVNRETKKVDWALFELPDAMQARNPDDVDVIVLLSRIDQPVGQYTNNRPAYQVLVTIKVIDLKNRALAAQKEFLGGEAPKSIRPGDPLGRGSDPTRDAVDYLIKLYSSGS
jgi:hypothetical protein